MDGEQWPRNEAGGKSKWLHLLMVRFSALDALRGLAILAMCFSGRIPWGNLPAWMYHAQTPPPDFQVSESTFGITWVDLVFPFFLFAMGAAIPLAYSQRRPSGPGWLVAIGVLQRGILLGIFAVIVQHIRPEQISASPSLQTHWLAIALFFAVAVAFAKWPKAVPPKLAIAMRVLGWLCLVVAMLQLPFRSGRGFDIGNSDTIIMVLAHVSVTGTAIWWLTRESHLARLAAIGIMAALFLGRAESDFASLIWNWTPAGWAYDFEFQKYLLILLPGTIAGDLYLASKSHEESPSWHVLRRLGIAAIGLGLPMFLVYSLFGREHSWSMSGALIASCVVPALALKAQSADERLVRGLAHWGAALLPIGVLLEPLGGGIRKDSPSTISYFFVTAGLAFFFLAALTVIVRGTSKRNPTSWLAEVGMNPMLAYVAITNLSVSVFAVTGIAGWVEHQGYSPWQLTLFAGVQTLFVGLIAYLGSRVRFFVRA